MKIWIAFTIPNILLLHCIFGQRILKSIRIKFLNKIFFGTIQSLLFNEHLKEKIIHRVLNEILHKNCNKKTSLMFHNLWVFEGEKFIPASVSDIYSDSKKLTFRKFKKISCCQPHESHNFVPFATFLRVWEKVHKKVSQLIKKAHRALSLGILGSDVRFSLNNNTLYALRTYLRYNLRRGKWRGSLR